MTRTFRRCRAGFLPAMVVALVVSAVSGCGSSVATQHASSSTPGGSSEAPLGYRKLPAFLPTSAASADRTVTATPSSPQLAVQGVAVQVRLPTGRALATVTGPTVPPFVSPPPPAVTATFAVSLTHVAGSLPIRLRDFALTDQLGRTFHPTYVSGEKTPPAQITTGHDLTFRVTAVMPTGEGRIYWSPRSAPLASWDFIVEND